MKKSKIWLSSPHMGGAEQKYIASAFETNWIAPLGPNVTGFENDIAAYLNNQKHVAALSSGTAALHLALKLTGIKPGDEVICQSMTFSASANPITYEGGRPVFVDSESDTWNMSPELLEQAIKDRIVKGQKPKAIIPVHLYGMPAKMKEIMAIARHYEIPVIEDAAEALGSRIDNKAAGTFGDYGILSFNGNKIITTSGGGALITNTQEAKEKAIFWATQARDNAPHYQHSEIGYNYRLSNILAGIGRGQMEILDKHIAARRANFDYYKTALQNAPLQFLQEPSGFFSNRWLTTVLTRSYEDREKIRLALANHNIESRPLWKPMHQQPVFKGAPSYLNGISDDLFSRGLCLPSGSNLNEPDRKRITEIILNQF